MTMTPEQAIEIVARHAIATAAERMGENGWESYDGLGEYDWERVSEKINELAPFPTAEEFGQATTVLEARVDPNA